MLGLLQPTDPSWVNAVEGDLGQLLSDHAHCELKAAQSALSLVARYGGEAPTLVEPLVALAHEETEHFQQVQQRLAQRGARLAPPSRDGYVRSLQAMTKPEHPQVPALLDRLLVCALIEGRSCERFRLLSERLRSGELRGFYRELMTSEARHFTLFTELARECFGRDDVRERFATLAEREATVAGKLPLGPQVHG